MALGRKRRLVPRSLNTSTARPPQGIDRDIFDLPAILVVMNVQSLSISMTDYGPSSEQGVVCRLQEEETESVSSEGSSLNRPIRHIPTPYCLHMVEDPAGESARKELNTLLINPAYDPPRDPMTTHLLHGLAHTVGSAVGAAPPSEAECLAAFQAVAKPKAGLTAGARAWSKHAHRSGESGEEGWWGSHPRGSVASINARALVLFERVVHAATWRNVHWLPHGVLVYEARVHEGYGMRWSRDLGGVLDDDGKIKEGMEADADCRSWMFRGFVEPMMENGHEVGWRH